MAKQCYEYDWHVWREEEIIPRNQELPADVFFIEIRTRYFAVTRSPQSDSFFHDDHLTEEPTGPEEVIESFCVNKNSLLYEEEEAKRDVLDALHYMGVPNHLVKVVFEDIAAWGWSMAEYPPNAGRSVLPMVLGFKIMAVETLVESCPRRISEFDGREAKRRRIEDSRICVT